MKYTLVLAMSLSAVAFADTKATKKAAPASHSGWTRNYGMAGCGLGSLVIDKNGAQILASTTNSTFYNQFFAITFGTSNCIDSDSAAAAHRMDVFVAANKAAVANDIAKGNGETLSSISKILNCDNTQQLGSALQGKFTSIFPKYDVSANDVTDHIITVIKSDSDLNQSCHIKG